MECINKGKQHFAVQSLKFSKECGEMVHFKILIEKKIIPYYSVIGGPLLFIQMHICVKYINMLESQQAVH